MRKEKSIDEIARETGEDGLEVREDRRRKEIEVFERIESIRILGPGSYELNLDKMARSDEIVVGLEKEGRYVVDILSMARKKK